MAGKQVNQHQENDVGEGNRSQRQIVFALEVVKKAASARPIRLIGFLTRFLETGG